MHLAVLFQPDFGLTLLLIATDKDLQPGQPYAKCGLYQALGCTDVQAYLPALTPDRGRLSLSPIMI